MASIIIIHVPDHTAVVDVEGPIFSGNAHNLYGGRIVGIFVYPPHPGKRGASCLGGCVKGRGWGRDKGGWMKCGGCGKRNPNVRRWLIKSLFDLLGANLYPDAPAAFRTPEGYGNPSQ